MPRLSDKVLTQPLREEIQQADRDDNQHHQGAGLLELETANRFPQGDANPACAHHADHRRGADVGLKAVQGLGDQERHNLRQDAIKDFFYFVGARCADAFHRAGLDGFDRFRKQLGEHAGGVDK